MKFLFRVLVMAMVLFIFSFYVSAHGMMDWKVPEKAKKIKNPVRSDDEKSISRGKELYKVNCLLCHGEKGDGKGPLSADLKVKPGNFTDKQMMQMMTDGEIFYKISKGKDPMPAWGDKLKENERWDLVNYIKTFAK